MKNGRDLYNGNHPPKKGEIIFNHVEKKEQADDLIYTTKRLDRFKDAEFHVSGVSGNYKVVSYGHKEE